MISKFHFHTNLIDNFLSTFSLTNDSKFDHEIEFISQPNVSFPKEMKNILSINVLIYFPREFEAFRSSYSIPLKEFINSLAESFEWKGNDPKSFKYKPVLTSYDEFFLFKSLKKKDFDSFLKIANEYFSYLQKTQIEQRPSLLVKIFGAFQISIQNKTFYYICMENLMAGLDIINQDWRIYDLKGTDINRYIPQDRINRALLDNNYKIKRNGEPLPIKIEDKRVFDQAIESDLDFLRSQNLIDYSLFLVENNEKGVIRVGIINLFKALNDKIIEDENINKKKVDIEKKREDQGNAVDYAQRFKKGMRKYFMEIVHDEEP